MEQARFVQASTTTGMFSHPMGEGQEEETCAASLELSASGIAGQSAAKPETFESHFLSPGERIKGEGGRKTFFNSPFPWRRAP
jgi:hypothetical protein